MKPLYFACFFLFALLGGVGLEASQLGQCNRRIRDSYTKELAGCKKLNSREQRTCKTSAWKDFRQGKLACERQ